MFLVTSLPIHSLAHSSPIRSQRSQCGWCMMAARTYNMCQRSAQAPSTSAHVTSSSFLSIELCMHFGCFPHTTVKNRNPGEETAEPSPRGTACSKQCVANRCRRLHSPDTKVLLASAAAFFPLDAGPAPASAAAHTLSREGVETIAGPHHPGGGWRRPGAQQARGRSAAATPHRPARAL